MYQPSPTPHEGIMLHPSPLRGAEGATPLIINTQKNICKENESVTTQPVNSHLLLLGFLSHQHYTFKPHKKKYTQIKIFKSFLSRMCFEKQTFFLPLEFLSQSAVK